MAEDDYLAIKIKPEFTQEDMQSFTDQLSQLMANATVNIGMGNGTTADGTPASATAEGGGMTEEAKKGVEEAIVQSQMSLATKGQTILKQVQAPTTESTDKMNSSLSGLMSGTLEVGKTIFSGVTSLFNLAKKATEGPLATVLNIMEKLFNLIFLPLNIALTMALIPIVQTMATKIATFVQSMIKAFDEKGLVGLIEETFVQLWELFTPLLTTLWNLFVEILPKMWKTLFDSGGLGTVLALLIALIPGITLGLILTKAFQTYASIMLLEIWSCETMKLGPLALIVLAITVIVTAITLIALNWDAVKKWCEDVWGKITGFGKFMSELITMVLDRLWEMISNLGGQIWDNMTGWIPHFASGGVVGANNPQLAWIGDNSSEPEVVAPYSTIVSAVGQALQSNSTLNTNNNSRATINNTFYITGTNAEEIGDNVARMMDKSVTKSTSKWGM